MFCDQSCYEEFICQTLFNGPYKSLIQLLLQQPSETNVLNQIVPVSDKSKGNELQELSKKMFDAGYAFRSAELSNN